MSVIEVKTAHITTKTEILVDTYVKKPSMPFDNFNWNEYRRKWKRQLWPINAFVKCCQALPSHCYFKFSNNSVAFVLCKVQQFGRVNIPNNSCDSHAIRAISLNVSLMHVNNWCVFGPATFWIQAHFTWPAFFIRFPARKIVNWIHILW